VREKLEDVVGPSRVTEEASWVSTVTVYVVATVELLVIPDKTIYFAPAVLLVPVLSRVIVTTCPEIFTELPPLKPLHVLYPAPETLKPAGNVIIIFPFAGIEVIVVKLTVCLALAETSDDQGISLTLVSDAAFTIDM
jgi:hypothetical protein